MKRVEIVATIGACVTAACLYLVLRADSLATNWQPSSTGNGWGGVTDPALRHTYQTVGIIGLCFGLAMLVLAVWKWLADTEDSRPVAQD